MAVVVDFLDSSSTVTCSINESLPRFIFSRKDVYNFSGTYSVSAFDDTIGILYPMLYMQKVGFVAGNLTRLADNNTLSRSNAMFISFVPSLPTYAFNNTTKVATLSPASIPTGWPTVSDRCISDYKITYVHTNSMVVL